MREPEAGMWMRRLAELSRNEDALPDPALIWWQARLQQSQNARARIARPIAIAQSISLVVAVVSVIFLCAVYSPGIKDMLEPVGFTIWVAGAGVAVLAAVALRSLFAE